MYVTVYILVTITDSLAFARWHLGLLDAAGDAGLPVHAPGT